MVLGVTGEKMVVTHDTSRWRELSQEAELPDFITGLKGELSNSKVGVKTVVKGTFMLNISRRSRCVQAFLQRYGKGAVTLKTMWSSVAVTYLMC